MADWKLKLKEYLIFILASFRRTWPVRLLVRLARAVIRGSENYSFNMNLNGESRVAQTLKAINPQHVFDVGANHGEWAQLALENCPGAKIHCFEIAAPTHRILTQKLGGEERVLCHPFGLAEKEGETTIQYGEGHDGHTSLIQPTSEGRFVSQPARVRRGDDYVSEQGIQEIDFLKIDVEGAEPLVLEGFRETLRRRHVKMIQFEYGHGNKLSGFLLKDFYELLTPLGFDIGKIYPHTVEFRPYHWQDEDFIGPNYLAIRSDLEGLRRRLTH